MGETMRTVGAAITKWDSESRPQASPTGVIVLTRVVGPPE
jgi:hypothetical protein